MKGVQNGKPRGLDLEEVRWSLPIFNFGEYPLPLEKIMQPNTVTSCLDVIPSSQNFNLNLCMRLCDEILSLAG